MKYKKTILSIIIIFVMSTFLFIGITEQAEAQLGRILGGVFGGKILNVNYVKCSCPYAMIGAIAIRVGRPKSAEVIYWWATSRLYKHYRIVQQNAWLLGNYRPGYNVSCWTYDPPYSCSLAKNQPDGVILKVGTSK